MIRLQQVVTSFAILAALTTVGSAQQLQQQLRLAPSQEQQPIGSVVSGRVVCADTQRAARFATVILIPVEEATGEGRDRDFGRRAGARTDLDGMFTATNVQPGDYYIAALATGYVSEAALLVAAGADPATALAKLPTVHVSAGAPSTANVSLERGSVVSGRVQWDDGTAAAGVLVNVVSATSAAGQGGGGARFLFSGSGGESAQTDDRGQFRLTGLAPGSYLVRGSVQAPAPGDSMGRGFNMRTANIAMFAPGKVRRSEAQTIALRAGEERDDVTIMMDLASLHRVTGRVGATSGTVASGTVRLVDTTDSSLSRVAQIASDGSYTLAYVPAGNYTLSVPYASSQPSLTGRPPRGGGDAQGSTFQPFQEALSVTDGDLTDINVNLTPATTAAK